MTEDVAVFLIVCFEYDTIDLAREASRSIGDHIERGEIENVGVSAMVERFPDHERYRVYGVSRHKEQASTMREMLRVAGGREVAPEPGSTKTIVRRRLQIEDAAASDGREVRLYNSFGEGVGPSEFLRLPVE